MSRQESKAISQRQCGAVMILFAVSLTVLLGFMALVIDLGRTYVVRTELQNAADSAALAGAKDLNQTAAGVTSAVTTAIAMAAQNNFKFSSPVAITIANLSVGSCPDDSCMVLASTVTSNALAAGKTFLKVDIPSVTLTAFVAQVIGIASTSTFGRAVAGHFLNNVTPLGVCAVDPVTKGGVIAATGELTEFGFRRGIAYNIPQLNPLGGANGDPIWINPLDSPPAACDPANAAPSASGPMRLLACTGTSAVVKAVGGFVYANTGGSYGPMEKALNSRFDDFTGGNACDPSTAPPDTNIKSYDFSTAANLGGSKDWMQPDPTQQSISINSSTHRPVSPISSAGQYGVLWSYSRAVRAVAPVTGSTYTEGTPFDLTDWGTLYLANGAATTTSTPAVAAPLGYPTGTVAPYEMTGTSSFNRYFLGPNAARPSKKNRRVLNVAILNCSVLISGPGLSCAQLQVVGVGKFFMQAPADLQGNPKKVETEFAGLIDPFPPSEVRLYK